MYRRYSKEVNMNNFLEKVSSDTNILCGSPDIISSPNILPKSTSSSKIDAENKFSEVLVLYTGGTIGMLRSKTGVYVPESGMMEQKLRCYPQLHDQEFIDSNFGSHQKNILALPYTEESFRVVYHIYEYSPLLDSSNMTMDDWIRIAMDIKKNYEKYSGFIILHGTDTMAYTASALSFMLENLGKTVIITGSQIPLYEARSDGRDNFMNSLIIAGNYCIPEVTILFNNKLFRGNRTSKVSTSCLDAFNSPNLPPLAKMGIGIHVEWRNIFRPSSIEKFSVHSVLNRNVGLLRLFPSITVEVVRAFLSPPIEGVVLQTYGAGNGPSRQKDLFDEFKRATRRGVIIVNCSQCTVGRVDPSYETGSALFDAGVISGSDMTPEAALTKLSYVLSKSEWSNQTKRTMIETNLRGELTVMKDSKLEDVDIISAIIKTLRLSSSEYFKLWNSKHLAYLSDIKEMFFALLMPFLKNFWLDSYLYDKEVDALRDALYPAILCSIVAEGNIEKLEIMRQFGAYLSACDYDYRTPLHIACSNGNVQIVEYLLKHGASVHMRDRDHRNPLMNAIDNDHHQVIKLIIKAGGYLNLPSTTMGEMLCSAARQNNIKRLESLFLAGADINEVDTTQRTALHYAIEMDFVESIKYLLEHNADISCKNSYGHSALDLVTVLHKEHLLYLFKKKCDMEITKKNEEST